LNLIGAIQPKLPAQIAIVGAGGKTTALFQLARQVQGLAWVTTTTHLGTFQIHLADKHFIIDSTEEMNLDPFKKQKVTLITGPITADHRLGHPHPEILEKLHQSSEREKISLFIEADGSRSLPVKAPAEHEPAIPSWTQSVITVIGLSALGQPLNPRWVFRPELFSRITDLEENALITMECLGDLLTHPEGGLKGIPGQAQKVALLNQADTVETQIQARSLVPKLLGGGYDKVVIGSLELSPLALECFQNN